MFDDRSQIMISAFIFSRKQKKTIHICYTRDIEFYRFRQRFENPNESKNGNNRCRMKDVCEDASYCELVTQVAELLACRILPRIVICCAEYNRARAREISDSVRQQPSTAKLERFFS